MPQSSLSLLYQCHQDFEGMAPTEKGAFCQSCFREVVDFTQKTEAEILHILQHAKETPCGLFRANQIQKPKDHLSLLKWAAAVMAAAGLIMGGSTTAQAQTDEFGNKPEESNEEKLRLVFTRKLDFRLMDNMGHPLRQGVVMVKTGDTLAAAGTVDAEGRVQMEVTWEASKTDVITIIGKSAGYTDELVKVSPDTADEVVIALIPEMEQVVVSVPAFEQEIHWMGIPAYYPQEEIILPPMHVATFRLVENHEENNSNHVRNRFLIPHNRPMPRLKDYIDYDYED